MAGCLRPSAQSPRDGDANADRVLAGALDAEGSGLDPPRRPLDRLPDDREGHARRRSVRRRPAHGEDSCRRTGSPLCLSEASPLTRGDLGVVSPWRARGRRHMSDYRVLRPFAWERTALQPRRRILRQSNPIEATDHQRVAMAEQVLRRGVSPLARVCRHGEIVPAGGSCARCQGRRSSAPVAVEARRHAATVAHTGRCGSGSLPSSPAGRCAAPAAAASSIPVSRGTSATPTARGRATTEQSTRPAIEARAG